MQCLTKQPSRVRQKSQISESYRLRILLVEDDLSMRRLITRFVMSTWPCHICEAEDGLAALDILLKDHAKFDLVILDMKLPFVSGVEVLRIMRSKPQFHHVPVLACTSVNESDQVKEMLKHGVQGYVLKPFDKQMLLQRVFEALGKRRRYLFPPTSEVLW